MAEGKGIGQVSQDRRAMLGQIGEAEEKTDFELKKRELKEFLEGFESKLGDLVNEYNQICGKAAGGEDISVEGLKAAAEAKPE